MMHKENTYKKLFDQFNHLSIMIIGDVMVDSYLWGKVERISPEAPIPIVALRKRENRLGGASNVAINIMAMGANPVLCSVIGTDSKGDTFLDLLKKEKIDTQGILRSHNRLTTTKFRIFGNSTQMLRVDEEVEHDLSEKDTQDLLKVCKKILDHQEIDCIIFQDYNKGVVTGKIIKEINSIARSKKILVTVDPKKRNFDAFEGVTLFKPNLDRKSVV
jgi:rfaE bifunctional protein kinase chain/domain